MVTAVCILNHRLTKLLLTGISDRYGSRAKFATSLAKLRALGLSSCDVVIVHPTPGKELTETVDLLHKNWCKVNVIVMASKLPAHLTSLQYRDKMSLGKKVTYFQMDDTVNHPSVRPNFEKKNFLHGVLVRPSVDWKGMMTYSEIGQAFSFFLKLTDITTKLHFKNASHATEMYVHSKILTDKEVFLQLQKALPSMFEVAHVREVYDGSFISSEKKTK